MTEQSGNSQPSGKAGLLSRILQREQPPEEIDLADAGNMEAGTAPETNSLPQVPGDRSRVLMMHVASLYDMYSNFKSGVASRLKTRMMTFMRHEIDNNTNSGRGASSAPRDIEGGTIARSSNVTYDSLIFKITILLGIILQFPVLWVAGALFFLSSNNFKASTIKWGSMNIILSALAFVYMFSQWHIKTKQYGLHHNMEENLVLDYRLSPEPWESTIFDGLGSANMISFDYSQPLKWTAFSHNDLAKRSEESYVLGRNNVLVDPHGINTVNNYYCTSATDVLMIGWIQFGAVFSNEVATDRAPAPAVYNGPGKFPIVYSPHGSMIFDIGMRCVAEDNTVAFIGVNATVKNNQTIESSAFYLPRMYTCSLAYSPSGSKPVVHSAYVKTL